jgi:hypothetical protein
VGGDQQVSPIHDTVDQVLASQFDEFEIQRSGQHSVVTDVAVGVDGRAVVVFETS